MSQTRGNVLRSRLLAPAAPPNTFYVRFAAFIPGETVSTDMPWRQLIPEFPGRDAVISALPAYIPPYRFIGGDMVQRRHNGRWSGDGFNFIEAGVDDHNRGSVSVGGLVLLGQLTLQDAFLDFRIAQTHSNGDGIKRTAGVVKGFHLGPKMEGPDPGNPIFWNVVDDKFYYPDGAEPASTYNMPVQTGTRAFGDDRVHSVLIGLNATNTLTMQVDDFLGLIKSDQIGRKLLNFLRGDITASLIVQFLERGQRLVAYRFQGNHDGFPAYEVYVGTREDVNAVHRVHEYTPRRSGATALDLMGDPEVSFSSGQTWLAWPPGNGAFTGAVPSLG
ncbi:MAG: hypothetical protein R3B70_15460 [Polyangiaceae bacterium]